MRTLSSHMNCMFHYEFNKWDPQLCKRGEYTSMVLREYSKVHLNQKHDSNLNQWG